jgi:hypothetical protein
VSPLQAWPHEHEFSNPAVLGAELRAFAQASGAPSNVLPTARALTDANRQDLLQVDIPSQNFGSCNLSGAHVLFLGILAACHRMSHEESAQR